jgi:hypothetical protein
MSDKEHQAVKPKIIHLQLRRGGEKEAKYIGSRAKLK